MEMALATLAVLFTSHFQLPRQARLVLHACHQMQTFLCNFDVRMKSKNVCASRLKFGYVVAY
jgi:hypothetical protein